MQTGWWGAPDPVVVLHISPLDKEKTRGQGNTLDPVWNQQLFFKVGAAASCFSPQSSRSVEGRLGYYPPLTIHLSGSLSLRFRSRAYRSMLRCGMAMRRLLTHRHLIRARRTPTTMSCSDGPSCPSWIFAPV